MNWRIAIVCAGCAAVLAGAAVASHRLAAETTEATPLPSLLYREVATAMPPRATWTDARQSVAFHGEMHALLTMAAGKPQWRRVDIVDSAQPPQRRKSTRAQRTLPRGDEDVVEVQVRDRHGKRIRVQRVERERADDAYRARAYAPVRPFGFFRW
jgi:hypothetical protein